MGLRKLDTIHALGPIGGGCRENGGTTVAGIARVFESFLQPCTAEALNATVAETDIALLGMRIIHPANAEVASGEISAQGLQKVLWST